MNENNLTKDQGIILTGATGKLCCDFDDFHKDVEKRIGRQVQVYEFASPEFILEVKKLYEEDFLKLIKLESKDSPITKEEAIKLLEIKYLKKHIQELEKGNEANVISEAIIESFNLGLNFQVKVENEKQKH